MENSTCRALYRRFCEHNYVPLSFQPWWLDAACGGPENWDVALAFDKSGEISGALPWHRARLAGLVPVAGMPPQTQCLGLWQMPPKAAPPASPEGRFSVESKIVAQVAAGLPRGVFFRQRFHPRFSDWTTFHDLGFRQTTRYSYRFDDLAGFVADGGIDRALRSNQAIWSLHKAEKETEVVENEDFASFAPLYEKSLRRRRLAPGPLLGPLARLDAALKTRGQRAILLALDRSTGQTLAAALLAWDERQTALLATGFDPEKAPGNQATWLLLERALRFAAEKAPVFDFEGSMSPGIGHVYRAFGAKLTPYSEIWRAPNRAAAIAFSLFKS